MNIHWDILDEKRKEILPLLLDFKKQEFYLAGGTGLALQIGHRDSIDFDFFIHGDFDTSKLISQIESLFSKHLVQITQDEKNTVSCVIDNKVQLSFFGYKQDTVSPLIQTQYFNIASIIDIGCMKLAAITSRSVEKDYVDLYFIFQTIQPKKLLSFCSTKYPTLDQNLILKSLVYFDDIQKEPILFKEGHFVSFDGIKQFLQKEVSEYFGK